MLSGSDLSNLRPQLKEGGSSPSFNDGLLALLLRNPTIYLPSPTWNVYSRFLNGSKSKENCKLVVVIILMPPPWTLRRSTRPVLNPFCLFS